jgi:hypothetical protein
MNIEFKTEKLFDEEPSEKRVSLFADSELVATLDYHYDTIGVLYIDLVRSMEENKGYATKLIDYIYNKFDSANIDWGEIQHPSAEHLYNKFAEKYGRSFSWSDWD